VAQGNGAPPLPPPVDSLAVEGAVRIVPDQILQVAGIPLHGIATYRDIAKAVSTLYSTGQFDDVRVADRVVGGKLVLVFIVKERPVLRDWSVTGPIKIALHNVTDLVHLGKGRAIDRAEVSHSRYAIDSMYHKEGYYSAHTTVVEQPTSDGVKVEFHVDEGSRVVISDVAITGNKQYATKELVQAMESKPEGFWWFRDGSYDEKAVDRDIRDHLPTWYGQRGLIDFQVTHDTLLADPKTGKATLKLDVEEGEPYLVGTVDILGNQRFSTEELATASGFVQSGQVGSGSMVGTRFDRTAWENATQKLSELYQNNGYISAQVEPDQSRRTLPNGTHVLDLRWRINEGKPATIHLIHITGNEVTHERVIREAIVLLPGELFNRDKLLRSYQNISNLGFFQQPMAVPSVDPAANGVDVDITFKVQEKHTGNINFGASLGQGTGLGGFLGLEEPNLFGRGKHGKIQYQFGQNINDFTLSYTDPALLESRLSGTGTLYDSQLKYIVGDLGEQRSAGGSLQIGIPFLGSRYSRVFASYGFQHVTYSGGAASLQTAFQCAPCTRSTLGLAFIHDNRIGLPFPVAGSLVSVNIEQNGGLLGGDGDYQKVNIDTRWFAPLGTLGRGNGFGGGVQFTLGFTAKSGFIFGNSANFFTELYSMGGVQYGIPLRGYSEFSITPNGYDPNASDANATPASFGKSYAAYTVEFGARVSQQIYVDLFADAGNVYRTAAQFDPTRLFRSFGIGAAVISPLGPIGVDLGYGIDKTDLLGHPAPGFQVHFRLGNFQ
jgi:outer membrane protein insertion porin family